MNRVGYIVVILAGLIMSLESHAKLNGKNVVFVHGLQFEAMLPPLRTNTQAREDAVDSQSGPELDKIIDERLYFHSGERLYQNIAYLKGQIKKMEAEEVCESGCYFITASTGDLVARYVFQNLRNWGIDSSKFWVIASFDLVGAGGGTELADWGVTIFEENFVTETIKSVIEALVPVEFWLAGIGHNLRPTIARSTARQHNSIPRLRFAGRGKNSYGPISGLILKGGDDSVVPLHSACGSSRVEAIWSCSQTREMGGKLVGWTSGAKYFMHNHYPLIMARDMHHTQIDYKGLAVPLNNYRNFSGVSVSLKQKTRSTGWWWWRQTYTTIDKPSNQTLVSYFIREFD